MDRLVERQRIARTAIGSRTRALTRALYLRPSLPLVALLLTGTATAPPGVAAQVPAPQPAAAAAPNPPPPIVSPDVSADRRVTFRFRAPNAREVLLSREGSPRVAMQKGDNGVWSVTTDPLEPDLYGYSFIADGVSLIDPMNPLMKPNLLGSTSMVDVSSSAAPWEVNNVPHGIVHHHLYKSGVIGDERDYYVYTPPGYDSTAKTMYPVLYLLHGFSDDASGWTAVGRAHLIMDNLIAQGKAKPMLIVMPLGYGAPEIVRRTSGGMRDPSLRQRNMDNFRKALLTEVIPQVEKTYRASPDRGARAIAGLSMGGAESLFTGLTSLDHFAWVGGFSSGGLGEDFGATFPALDAKANAQLKLLWIACGTDDRLIEANRKFREWLKSKGVQPTEIETPGAHTWMVWRRNLATFAPLLFQAKSAAAVPSKSTS
jgi:enterochelin esterase-like enzyme